MTNQSGHNMDERTVKVNRIKLLAVFAVALVPLFVAVLMYFAGWAVPTGKTNKGNLIWPPVPLTEVQPNLEADDKPNETKWLLMLSGGTHCDQVCTDLLHTMRQVNVAMGRELDRVDRLIISAVDQESLAEIQKEYPKLSAMHFSKERVRALQKEAQKNGAKLSSDSSVVWTVWLVDPIGNVILQYTQDHDGYDMIHDLKKLLKLSNIG